MDVAAIVTAILARQAVRDPATLRPGMRLDDLGIDSLGRVEVVFAIEEQFDLSVPFNANTPDAGGFDLTSVGSVIAAVEALLGEGRG
ncbi:MAG: acyl carrier protein [Rhodobacteraceae bacterium]|nr:acyl carrier protein [Paracoccaceae bacterium]